MSALLEVERLSKTYIRGTETIHALKQVSFTLEEGGFIAIMGTSGSGKSTLLNILGALDAPTSGTLTLKENGNATSSLNLLRRYTDNNISASSFNRFIYSMT